MRHTHDPFTRLFLLFGMTLLVAVSATAQVTGSQGTDGTNSAYLDSLYTAGGCISRTAAQASALADALGSSTPYTKVLLDSAGIIVTDDYRSGGPRVSDGSIMYCPGQQPMLRFSGGTVMLVGGNRPAVERTANGYSMWHLVGLIDRPWIDVNDSTTWRGATRDSVTAIVNFGYPSWREAVTELAPRFHTGTQPPPVLVVITPPIVKPPIAIIVEPRRRSCDGHPIGFVVKTMSGNAIVLRAERSTVIIDSDCRGVVTLRSATTYRLHTPPCDPNGTWTTRTTSYTSRVTAHAAAARLAPCPAT